MNLCNIHTHTNAENKGPDFSIKIKNEEYGGYACNETNSLTQEQLKDPFDGNGPYKGVKPGDTIEVHWVYTSCDIRPGHGIKSCISDECTDPKLRVESQVFLLVNDSYALNFGDYSYGKTIRHGFHQAKNLPSDTGKPIVFRGSTTSERYNKKKCSPIHVTWSVRPQCVKLNIASLHAWAAKGSVFAENRSYHARKLITNPKLLSPIQSE
ncbi:MAG: cadmium carbonic anhydrase [Rickettsiaceae bacterium H1]|nr:cadmium carbonic anhydrase [Rickettsiaceae bacterium H1]